MGLWGPGGSSGKRSGTGGRRGGTLGQLDCDQTVDRAARRSTVQRTPPGGSGRTKDVQSRQSRLSTGSGKELTEEKSQREKKGSLIN